MGFVLGDSINVTPRQLEVLSILSSRDSWSVGELAIALGVSSAAATKSIARLQRKGMVKRSENLYDRRSVDVCVTRAGREVLHAMNDRVLQKS